MASNRVTTERAPKPIGPYSQAVSSGGFLFVSGQVALDPETGGLVGATVGDQTEQVFKNVSAILEAAGVGLGDVVKATVFLTDLSRFDEMNKVYGRFLGENPPARSCVEVRRLPKDVAVEIEVIARHPR
jgi:2-iminobutanoate/2-iminopropanoate deaminase